MLAEFDRTGQIDWVTQLAEVPAKFDVSNVYAELGTTFGSCAVTHPKLAAAVLGTLIKGMGADHVVWGTDSVWYGSPQWQIEAFRRIEIPEAMQKAHGRLYIDGNDFGDEDGYLGYQGHGEIKLASGQSLVVFEDYTGAFDYAVHSHLRFTLGEGAKLTRVVILDEPETAVSVRQSTVETAPGSVFKQYVFSTGAKFQRFETHVNHAGHGADGDRHVLRADHDERDGGDQRNFRPGEIEHRLV